MFWELLILLVVTYFLVDRLLRLLKIGNHGDKYVFITGCDSGFGHNLAKRLDRMGFPVFAGCLTQDGRQNLSKQCSDRLVTLSLNVVSVESIEAALDEVKNRLPAGKDLWAVVNNAGITGLHSVAEMCTKKDYQDCCDINLFGPIEVSRIFLPLLRKSRGRIINMTSVMGRCPTVAGPYCVAKFGLEAFSDVLRREVSQFGIKVCIIEPGFFRTTLLNFEKILGQIKEGFDGSSEEVKASYGHDYLEVSKRIMESTKDQLASEDIYKVVDAYVDAITCQYPRARYVVGWDAKLFFVPLSFLPEWIGDWLVLSQRKKFSQKSN